MFCDNHFVCGTYFLFPSGQVFCVDCLSRPTAVLIWPQLLSFVVKFGQYNYTRWTHLSPVLSLRLIQVTTFILFQNIYIVMLWAFVVTHAMKDAIPSVIILQLSRIYWWIDSVFCLNTLSMVLPQCSRSVSSVTFCIFPFVSFRINLFVYIVYLLPYWTNICP